MSREHDSVGGVAVSKSWGLNPESLIYSS